jgi:alkanesulfonate monooxygenase SsuD/methylene tetrahydromethanopterin reductase-like flavin-dependent oxidoreductase (luciferase family)
MRFFTFHYMPYQGLDAVQAIDDYGVGWCTLPNSMCDPGVMASNYRDYVDQAALADELGFDGVTVNEHHQTPFGTMPSPNVMAGAIAERTTRARIAVFGNALPLRSTPLSSIEEYTMIDLLSSGRLEAGFVVGGGPEYYSFALSPTNARDRFAEGLALVRRAWSEPGPFRWDGEYYQLDCVNPWPRPVQQPHPPIWVCGIGSPSTLEMCAREDIGYMGVNASQGHVDFVGQCEYLRKAADEYGRQYDPARMGWLTHIHVADSDEQALEEFGAHAAYGGLLTRGFGGPAKTFYPPGHLPPDRLAKWERQTRESYAAKPMPGDAPLMGKPETVANRLISRLKDYKIGNVAMAFQWGTMPHDMVTRSMRMFAEQVMPIVRAELDAYLDDLYPQRTQSAMATGVGAK